jgi:hypothetical protein
MSHAVQLQHAWATEVYYSEHMNLGKAVYIDTGAAKLHR